MCFVSWWYLSTRAEWDINYQNQCPLRVLIIFWWAPLSPLPLNIVGKPQEISKIYELAENYNQVHICTVICRQFQGAGWHKATLHRRPSFFRDCGVSSILSWMPTPGPETPGSFPSGRFFLGSHKPFLNHLGSLHLQSRPSLLKM